MQFEKYDVTFFFPKYSILAFAIANHMTSYFHIRSYLTYQVYNGNNGLLSKQQANYFFQISKIIVILIIKHT